MISESAIIKALSTESGGFIGDDAAILPVLYEEQYVITKDLLVEDIHFRTHYFAPNDLAHKALHVNLSDLSAMGARPLYVLCGIAIPSNLEQYAYDVLEHLSSCCKEANVMLVGGDTTASSDKLFISITAIGAVSKVGMKRRSSAQTEDLICVAGHLGWAHLGLMVLEKRQNTDTKKSVGIFTKFTEASLRPNAKTKEGIWLSKEVCVTSMMDISDGLYVDLQRLSRASEAGAVIELDALEYSSEFEDACKICHIEPLTAQLVGGEDYGLLFTVSPDSFDSISQRFKDTFGYGIRRIGRITKGSLVTMTQNNEDINLNIKPFTHFGEKI